MPEINSVGTMPTARASCPPASKTSSAIAVQGVLNGNYTMESHHKAASQSTKQQHNRTHNKNIPELRYSHQEISDKIAEIVGQPDPAKKLLNYLTKELYTNHNVFPSIFNIVIIKCSTPLLQKFSLYAMQETLGIFTKRYQADAIFGRIITPLYNTSKKEENGKPIIPKELYYALLNQLSHATKPSQSESNKMNNAIDLHNRLTREFLNPDEKRMLNNQEFDPHLVASDKFSVVCETAKLYLENITDDDIRTPDFITFTCKTIPTLVKLIVENIKNLPQEFGFLQSHYITSLNTLFSGVVTFYKKVLSFLNINHEKLAGLLAVGTSKLFTQSHLPVLNTPCLRPTERSYIDQKLTDFGLLPGTSEAIFRMESYLRTFHTSHD